MSLFSCNTILHLADVSACAPLSGYHTSIGSIEFNAKISIRSTGIMTGSEDDATNGFVFHDHTWDGRRGHYPVVSNDQTTHLRKCHKGLDELAGMSVYLNISEWGKGGNATRYQA